MKYIVIILAIIFLMGIVWLMGANPTEEEREQGEVSRYEN